DLARHAGHLAGEGVELVHHRVDGFLKLQNLAADIDGDLLGQVAAGDCGRDVGDVAHLSGQVAGHEVDAVGEVLPGAGHTSSLRPPADAASGADLARHARYFRRKCVELVHHRVDGVFEFQNFPAHIDGDLAGQVSARDGGRDLGNVAHLCGEVAAHGIDRVSQVFPSAGDAGHDRLAAELAVGANLARHARDFRGERAQLIHHGVDGFLELQDLAAHV